MMKLQLPIMYLGPYQYKLATIEHFFGFIKNNDLNPLQRKSYSKAGIQTYLKEIALQISQMNYSWLQSSFISALTPALEAIALLDLWYSENICKILNNFLKNYIILITVKKCLINQNINIFNYIFIQ